MGLVYADIELINSEEIGLARRRIIGEQEIKRMHINMFVDSGAYNLCINENIQSQLQLPFIGKELPSLPMVILKSMIWLGL